MSRPGITYLDVAQAATALMEQDTRPTIETVRQKLGTGSNSTINRHLRAWREQQGHQIEQRKGLPESLLIAVKGLYDGIQADASQQIETIQSDCREQIETLNTEIKVLNETHAKALQANKASEHALETERTEKGALATSLNNTQKQCDTHQQQVTLLTAQLTDKKDEIERLIQQLTHAQHNLEHYRESVHQERETERQKYEGTIARLEKQHLKDTAELTTAREQLAALNQHCTSLQGDKKSLTEQLEKITKESHHHEMSFQQLDVKRTALKDQHDRLTESHHNSLKQIEDHKAEQQQMELKTERLSTKLSALKETHAKAEDRLKHLSEQNLFLTQEKARLATELKQVLTTVQKTK